MKCINCKKRKRRSTHSNTKYCEPCRLSLLRRPKSTLTREQRERVKELIGKMPREEICAEIGCSLANLKRAFRGVRLAYHNKYAINPKLVSDVCSFYEKHGKIKTQKQFPGVKIRSVVERYKQFKPRQIRWTDSQFIELAKYAGLISHKRIAKLMNRPNAFAGSIKSFYCKRLGIGAGGIHGLSYWVGRELVTEKCPYLETEFWSTRRKNIKVGRKLFLWIDMEKFLRPDVPLFIKEAVISMANFQRWLFQSNNPRSQIMKIVKLSNTRTESLGA